MIPRPFASPRRPSRLIVGIGCTLALMAAAGCRRAEPPPLVAPPPEVGVLTVDPADLPLERTLVGRLAPFRSADVRARVPGVLIRRVYKEGSDVKAGAVMFEIDAAPLQAALNGAQAALAQAQANATNARVAATRARDLAPKGFVSRADRDNAEAAERSAHAAVQQARAAVERARIDLGYATVRAPIDGRAGQQQVTEGALVGQGGATLLATVEQVDPLYANFSLGANELEAMRRAQSEGQAHLDGPGTADVEITLSDGSVYPHRGRLDFSDTAVDPATGAVTLRATVPNPDRRLLPGLFVNVRARLGQRRGVFAIPQAAVQRDAAGPYVLTVDALNLVVRKNVVTDSAIDGQWIVTAGLEPGDRLVVSGLQRAQPGKPANPVPWQPAPPASGTPAAPPAAAPSAAH